MEMLEQRFVQKTDEKAYYDSEVDIIDLYVSLDKAALDTYSLNSKVYVGEFNGWVSFLHSEFSWGTVEEYALSLSLDLHDPVLAVSYFDDDILSIGVYLKGTLVNQHIKSYGNYGIDDKEMDIWSFIQTLDIQVTPKEVRFALFNHGIQKQVEELEKLLCLPLWIDAEWIGESDLEYYEEIGNRV
ncbi:hypothetical protein [Paenibacillus sp. PAMC21692]|uniref:hypothetical protein n=1 Tax=Paenibacillus sp. PAMC21692 TaxID=2762320 RepID=UPI00164E9E83|nr:hypothetical protein [Paenibacillus sp. PAMC21692]QNK54690.1 hypothetical protein H7F31_18765 [Paenibacillus sp. PAMC21692]